MFNWAAIRTFIEDRFKPIITIGTVIGMLAGLFVWWHNAGLPRFAYASEIAQVVQNSAQTQLDYYMRAKRSDERALFDLDQQIEDLKRQNKPIPDATVQQRIRIIEDLEHSKVRINDAQKQIN